MRYQATQEKISGTYHSLPISALWPETCWACCCWSGRLPYGQGQLPRVSNFLERFSEGRLASYHLNLHNRPVRAYWPVRTLGALGRANDPASTTSGCHAFRWVRSRNPEIPEIGSIVWFISTIHYIGLPLLLITFTYYKNLVLIVALYKAELRGTFFESIRSSTLCWL